MKRKHAERALEKESTRRQASTVPSRTRSPAPLPFEVRPSSIHGVGAYALRKIRREERICEYVGERISDDESNRRYDDEAMSNHHTFLFSVRGGCIDGGRGGNDSRFINHSCDPNCEARLERNRVFLYALRTIQAGEELCYDYAYERSEEMSEEDISRYPCRCLAPNCRGTILAPETTREDEVSPPKERTKRKRTQTKVSKSKKARRERGST